MRTLCLSILAAGLLTSACGTSATPVVIRDQSAAQTRTAVLAPTPTLTGPTAAPSLTPTPYQRPTDDPALELDRPIVRVGTDTITLGQFRKRVRYERFLSLDSVRHVIEELGLPKLMRDPGQNKALNYVMSVFNTLSNSGAFGNQVYDNMLRGSVIRQEFKARGLSLTDAEIRDNWIRILGLQTTSDIDAKLPAAIDAFISRASSYSGLTSGEITDIIQLQMMSDKLRPLIVKERGTPSVVQFRLRHILTASQSEADVALAKIKQGEDFRTVACQVSIDPATRGQSAQLSYTSKSKFVAGLQNTDAVFNANAGDIVGPLQGPSGWYDIRVKDRRKNPDGDTEVAAQTIIVATQSLATDIVQRAQKGEDFATLACQYSLDNSISTGGELTSVDPVSLPANVAAALRSSNVKDVVGPLATAQGYEIYLVEDRKITVLKPDELEKAEVQTFIDWQTSRINSDFVVSLSDVWQQAIPTDPLPRDVSPLMVEQNFGLPTPEPSATPTAAKQ